MVDDPLQRERFAVAAHFHITGLVLGGEVEGHDVGAGQAVFVAEVFDVVGQDGKIGQIGPEAERGGGVGARRGWWGGRWHLAWAYSDCYRMIHGSDATVPASLR